MMVRAEHKPPRRGNSWQDRWGIDGNGDRWKVLKFGKLVRDFQEKSVRTARGRGERGTSSPSLSHPSTGHIPAFSSRETLGWAWLEVRREEHPQGRLS